MSFRIAAEVFTCLKAYHYFILLRVAGAKVLAPHPPVPRASQRLLSQVLSQRPGGPVPPAPSPTCQEGGSQRHGDPRAIEQQQDAAGICSQRLSRPPPYARDGAGRKEMSEQPEIGRAERLRCRLRTAAPPPPPPGLQLLPGALPLRRPPRPPLLHSPPPAGPAGSPPGPRARSLPRPRQGRTGRLPEPAGGARAQEPRAPDTSQPGVQRGVQPAPQPLAGGRQPRGADPSRAGVSPPPGALGASSLSPGNPPLTGDATPLLLTPGCPNPMRKQKMGRRGASPPCCLPGAPSFGKGRRRGPATFHSLLCFPLAGAQQRTAGLSAQRGEAPSIPVFWAYVSARPDSREDRS
ncbi:uncharacterized protein [Callorhinus ursinus]|uniref:uncharacterized protein n=1 Tax=Callorhinus ursinus TaxID=34884 RepID=UPI003CD00234